jgi:hypothetical protein
LQKFAGPESSFGEVGGFEESKPLVPYLRVLKVFAYAPARGIKPRVLLAVKGLKPWEESGAEIAQRDYLRLRPFAALAPETG